MGLWSELIHTSATPVHTPGGVGVSPGHLKVEPWYAFSSFPCSWARAPKGGDFVPSSKPLGHQTFSPQFALWGSVRLQQLTAGG